MEKGYKTMSEVETMENTDNLYILFEEDPEGTKNYDLSRGIFEGLENAKAALKSEKAYNKEPVFIAKYNDYMEGNYNYID